MAFLRVSREAGDPSQEEKWQPVTEPIDFPSGLLFHFGANEASH